MAALFIPVLTVAAGMGALAELRALPRWTTRQDQTWQTSAGYWTGDGSWQATKLQATKW